MFVDTTMEQDVPTAFSPNGDGVNDVFRPVGMKFQNLVEFRVYNRWGQRVYSFANPNDKWNGKLNNGNEASEGTYYYIINAVGTNNILARLSI